MRHALLLALLLGAAALAAVEAPRSASDSNDSRSIAEEEAQPEPPVPPTPTETVPVPETPVPSEPPVPLEGAPAPVPVPVPEPLPAPPPAADFLSPRQGVFGPIVPVEPAHKLAMLETNAVVAEDDPLVARASYLLSQSTARYIEDAPRVADLTIRVCREIRARQRSASPLEMLEAAETWKRPATTPGSVPRRFEHFAAQYRKLRVDEGKDHAQALSAMRQASSAAR